jgi:UDPglucose--hexose-1-phosphate uridylyltransferase
MARDLLTAFRDRGRAHRDYQEIEHSVFFKNHGSTAGASLVHPHSQIVSTPVVPVEAQRLQALELGYFRRNRTSLYKQLVQEELALYHKNMEKSRVVDITENFVAVVPYASPGPYVLTILPRFDLESSSFGMDSSDFCAMTDDVLDECAFILHSCLKRLHVHLHEPCFNLVVQTAPVPKRGVQASLNASAYFRWHIRITPRLGAGAMAGFELGSGFFSNSHMPEDDAAELRAAFP